MELLLKDTTTRFKLFGYLQSGVLDESPRKIPSLFITLPFRQRYICCNVRINNNSLKRASQFHAFAHRFIEFILFVSSQRGEIHKINEINERETFDKKRFQHAISCAHRVLLKRGNSKT